MMLLLHGMRRTLKHSTHVGSLHGVGLQYSAEVVIYYWKAAIVYGKFVLWFCPVGRMA
jgi:hypothetical protein